MIINFDKAEKIHDKVYVYHNAFTDDFCDVIRNRATSSDKYDGYEIQRVDTEVKILQDRSIGFEDAKEVLTNLLNPGDGVMFSDLCITHVQQGRCWGPHEDSMKGRGFNDEGRLFFAGVLYLNDFDGGDIDYPDIDVNYKGKKGDLIIHDANEWHFVNRVKTADRYAMTFYIWKNHDDIYNKFVAKNGKMPEVSN
jgi:hypothetical protein